MTPNNAKSGTAISKDFSNSGRRTESPLVGQHYKTKSMGANVVKNSQDQFFVGKLDIDEKLLDKSDD